MFAIGAQTSVHFISKPNIKNPGRRAGREQRPSRSGNLSWQRPFLLSPGKGKLAAPRKKREAATAQSSPSRSCGRRCPAPGVLRLAPQPPYPGSKCGSWTRSVRLQASPSTEPEETLAASDYARTLGWKGRDSGLPPRPPERRTGPPGSQEAPGRPAYPDLLSPGGPAGPGTRDPRALAPRAGYLLSLRSYRGGARRGEARRGGLPGASADSAPAPSADRRPFSRSSN